MSDNSRVSLIDVEISDQNTGVVDLVGCTLVGIYMPTEFTGTEMTFLAVDDEGVTRVVNDGAGNDLTKTVAANKMVILNPADFAGVKKVIIRASTSQAAARKFQIAMREVN